MSALDKLFARCDETAFRMALTSFADTDADDAIEIGKQVEAARAEVAAMRQRVGDLECLFRWAREIQRDSKSWIFSRSEVVRQDLSVLHPDRYAHKMMVLESDSTGLPLLTDEARKALRGRE